VNAKLVLRFLVELVNARVIRVEGEAGLGQLVRRADFSPFPCNDAASCPIGCTVTRRCSGGLLYAPPTCKWLCTGGYRRYLAQSATSLPKNFPGRRGGGAGPAGEEGSLFTFSQIAAFIPPLPDRPKSKILLIVHVPAKDSAVLLPAMNLSNTSSCQDLARFSPSPDRPLAPFLPLSWCRCSSRWRTRAAGGAQGAVHH
jgi:hypothetical protein